jgi:DNA-binding transcriptional LysR family regulator
VFVTVAGLRSFTRAARALGRSPQAITRAIAALEHRLGTTAAPPHHPIGLAHRRRGAAPRARPARPGGVRAARVHPRAGAPLTGRLSVTAPILFGQMHVLPVVIELLGRYPRPSTCGCCSWIAWSRSPRRASTWASVSALSPTRRWRARLVGHVRWLLCASPALPRARRCARARPRPSPATPASPFAAEPTEFSPIAGLPLGQQPARAFAVPGARPAGVNTGRRRFDAPRRLRGSCASSRTGRSAGRETEARVVLPPFERWPRRPSRRCSSPRDLFRLVASTRRASAFVELAADRLASVASRGI